ncbi:MAG: hypothetical protein GIW94_14000 [Candidatus Eremiobacteraeota bacterium]|nr:hypothetical protein [Candidatus Eremiobacteraeota bacterium]
MGVYPLLHDDRGWFLAANFDGQNWAEAFPCIGEHPMSRIVEAAATEPASSAHAR